jgi:hypothetical protein
MSQTEDRIFEADATIELDALDDVMLEEQVCPEERRADAATTGAVHPDATIDIDALDDVQLDEEIAASLLAQEERHSAGPDGAAPAEIVAPAASRGQEASRGQRVRLAHAAMFLTLLSTVFAAGLGVGIQIRAEGAPPLSQCPPRSARPSEAPAAAPAAALVSAPKVNIPLTVPTTEITAP